MWAVDVPEPAVALPDIAPAVGSALAGAFAARWLAQAPSSSSAAAAAIVARLNMACPPRDLGCYSQQQIAAALSSAPPARRRTVTRSSIEGRARAPGLRGRDQGTSMPTDVPSAAAGSPSSNGVMASARSTTPNIVYQ